MLVTETSTEEEDMIFALYLSPLELYLSLHSQQKSLTNIY